MGELHMLSKCLRQIKKRYLPFFFFLLLSVNAISQDLAQHNWLFGNSSNAIRFNRGNNKAILATSPTLLGLGGSAVATDPSTGNLLFYSDGITVYDANSIKMKDLSNGPHFPLSGNITGNQPVVFCPVPVQVGQPTKYFVFTNNANGSTPGTIQYVVVDLALPGNSFFPSPPTGAIASTIATDVNGLIANRSEGMIIVPHANGRDYWLITHQNGSATYNSTLIDPNSLLLGFTPSTPSPNVGLTVSVANFSYNHKLKKLAIAVQSAKDNSLIADFNPTTGAIALDRFINNTGDANAVTASTYDIQWDIKGGQYLYISRMGDAGVPADVLQYDYAGWTAGSPTVTILTSIYPTPGTITQSYGLHLAPDSAIYHIYQTSSSSSLLVEKFTKTDLQATSIVITPLPFGNIDFKGQQFPSFLPRGGDFTINFKTAPSNPPDNLCQNGKITFLPEATPNADSLFWDFGDASARIKGWSPVHAYANAGTFQVKLTAFYQGRRKELTKPITITQFDLKIQLNQEETACECELPINSESPNCPTINQFKVTLQAQGETGNTKYVWSNGDQGKTLSPKESGYYYVTATDQTIGCSTYAGVNVKQYGLSDQRSNIWYFGEKAGIDFNPLTPLDPPSSRAITTSAMTAPEGCAIVCDRNGDVVFYTNGKDVYDKTNTQLLTDFSGNPINLGGDPDASQSSIIISVPGDETLFYIFTIQPVDVSGTKFEVRYSIFDLKKNGGNGAITNQNILLFSKSTERITASGQWLIAHEYGNSTFRSYKITNQGIGEAVYSDIGSVHSFSSTKSGQGYMKLGPRDNIAVALSTGTQNLVELFQLNDTTGVVRNYRKIDLNQPSGQVYGVEFSRGGRKLFVTIKDSPSSRLYEYFLDDKDIAIPTLVPPSPLQRNAEFGALQLAPDGQIYMAVNGNGKLTRIVANENATVITASSVTFDDFDLLGRTSKLGLPNFLQQLGNGFGGPDFVPIQACSGETVNFTGTPTDQIDEFEWDFGDGTVLPWSKNATPSHQFPLNLTNDPIIYKVTMRLRNKCTTLIPPVVKDFTVFPAAPQPTILPQVLICSSPVSLNANTGNLPDLNFLWSDGSPNLPSVLIDKPKNISVEITNKFGCKSKASSTIVSRIPQVDLPAKGKICQNDNSQFFDVGNQFANSPYVIQWKINNVNAGTTSRQIIDTSTPGGPFVYSVTVTNTTIPGCSVTDSEPIEVQVSPNISFIGADASACGSTDGSVTLSIFNSSPLGGPRYSYEIFGTGLNPSPPNPPTGAIDVTTAAPAFLFTGKANVYTVFVTDQISGCETNISAGIGEPALFSASASATSCDQTKVSVFPTFSTPLVYSITSQSSPTPIATKTSNNSSEDFNLPIGTYVIGVRDQGGAGCLFTFNYTVPPTSLPTVSFTSSLCGSDRSLTASLVGGGSPGPGNPFSWTLPNGTIVNRPNGQLGQTDGLTTSGIYKVDVTLSTTCVVSGSIPITILPAITADFSPFDQCSTNVRLVASPANTNFIYQWSQVVDGVPTILSSLAGVEQFFVQTSGTYSVTIFDSNGCPFTSQPKSVTVAGTVSVSFNSSIAPCEDGNPFTLSATPIPSDATIEWFFNNSTTPLAGKNTPSIEVSDPGTYKIKVTKGVNCSDEKSKTVTRIELPVGDLIPRVIICADPENRDDNTNQVKLDPGEHDKYNWFYQASSTSSRIPLAGVTPDVTRVVTVRDPGFFLVEITDRGCTATNQTEVLNECIPKIVGPNAFRPSSIAPQYSNKFGDFTNKEFFLYSYFISDNFEIAIYNRWGELVFQSSDKYFRWNGGYNNNGGQPLPGGTYTYVVRYQSSYRPQDGTKEQRGGVVLLR